MTASVLRSQNLDCLLGGDPARPAALVLGDQAGERLTDDEAHVQGQARVRAGRTARAFQRNDMIGMLQHNLARQRIGDDVLQIAQRHIPVHAHPLFRGIQRDHLAVVSVGEADLAPGRGSAPSRSRDGGQGNGIFPAANDPRNPPDQRLDFARQGILADADADIQIKPTGVDVAMQPIDQRETRFTPGFAGECTDRGARPNRASHRQAYPEWVNRTDARPRWANGATVAATTMAVKCRLGDQRARRRGETGSQLLAFGPPMGYRGCQKSV